MTDQERMELRLRGYQLTTAEIFYHLPDHPRLLQSYVWQEYDMAPKFPVLSGFLAFWTRNLDGKLHSVRLATTGIFSPTDIRVMAGEYRVH